MLQILIRFSMNIPLNSFQIKLYSYLIYHQIPVKINLFLMGSSGLEPPTSRLSGARSNQLSYEPACRACPSSACLRAFTRFHHQLKSLFTTTMEMMGFEPMTPCLQGRCSPNWATPPLVYRISFLFQWAYPSLKIEQQPLYPLLLPNLVFVRHSSP